MQATRSLWSVSHTQIAQVLLQHPLDLSALVLIAVEQMSQSLYVPEQ